MAENDLLEENNKKKIFYCIMMILIIFLYLNYRRKAPQMFGMREGIQSKFKPYHSFEEAYRIQTICLRTLPQGIPAESRSEAS